MTFNLNELNLQVLTIDELLKLSLYLDDLLDSNNTYIDTEIVPIEFIKAGVFEYSLNKDILRFLREQEARSLKLLYKLSKDVRDKYREQLVNIDIEKRTKTSIGKYFKSTKPTLPIIIKDLDMGEINLIAAVKSEDLYEPLLKQTIEAGEKGVERGFKDLKTKISFKLDESPYAKFYKDRAKEFSKQVATNLQAQIKEKLILGIKEGKGIPELAKDIRGIYSKPILVKVKDRIDPKTGKIIRRGYTREISNRQWSEMVARTETSWAMNEGRLAAYKEARLVKNVKWIVATEPCEDCAIMEGQILELFEAEGMIPYHPHCKCTWIVNEYKKPEDKLTEPPHQFSEDIHARPNGIGIMEIMKMSPGQHKMFDRALELGNHKAAEKLLRRQHIESAS